jgi:hypothetical protein
MPVSGRTGEGVEAWREWLRAVGERGRERRDTRRREREEAFV